MYNIYLTNNKSIVPGDMVRIDGIDQKSIFEFHGRSEFPQNLNELKFKVEKQDNDDNGAYYFLNGNDHAISRFTLTKVGKPLPLDIKNIKIGYNCIIGKDIFRAPKIKNLNELITTHRNRCERFIVEKEAEEAVNEYYTIIDIKDEYVCISQNNKSKITYVFPYWFLYDANYNLYKPKKIIRSFDDF